MNLLSEKNILKRSLDLQKNCIAHLSIDCTVFGFHENELKIILIKFAEQELWGLPGGYVFKKESINEAANRILYERTGVHNIYLNQFKTFGELNRSESFFENYPKNSWQSQRFITLGYYALIDFSKVSLTLDDISEKIAWVNVSEIETLMMDHKLILDSALASLRRGLNHRPIGLNLLQDEFTMPELQKLYETILGKKLNRGNFYRKIMKYDILEIIGEKREGKANKSPILYKFNLEKYNNALEEGFKEIW